MTPRHPPTARSSRSPRWDVLGSYRVDVDGMPFLRRLRLVQTPWFAVLLTRILEPDPGRDPHNHSRPFVTLILKGCYAETVYPAPELLAGDARSFVRGVERIHPRWSLMGLPQSWAHSITGVQPGTLTLVLAGRHRGSWSFWTADGPVDWRDYG